MREPLKDPIRLLHILEAIDNIEKASVGLTLQKLQSDVILRHGLTWNVMVIGEAANKLSKEFCNAHPATDWRAISGMRHVLVHDYYQINESELFSVILDDIPLLKPQIIQYLEESKQGL